MIRRITPALFLLVALSAYAQDVNDATEKAMKEAALKVAPSIARIETSGGAEAVWGGGRKGPGGMFRRRGGASPRPGADPHGDIITRAFHFLGKPTGPFVTVPGPPPPGAQ